MIKKLMMILFTPVGTAYWVKVQGYTRIGFWDGWGFTDRLGNTLKGKVIERAGWAYNRL